MNENNFMNWPESRKAGRGGHSLLTGLLRCGRCGRKMYTYYTGKTPGWCRYLCRGVKVTYGEGLCISFSNQRPDVAVAEAILRAVEPRAIEAAIQAAAQVEHERNRQREAVRMELEQAKYQAQLAGRRYDTVDPDNRLVADELESRWNLALRHVQELEEKVERMSQAEAHAADAIDAAALLRLAVDLPPVWDACEDLRLKQRIAHILIEEVVADVDGTTNEVVMKIHWVGGRHSEERVVKPRTGEHRNKIGKEASEIIHQMVVRFPDEVIASTLNRLGLKTGAGNTWRQNRVRSFRNERNLPCFDPSMAGSSGLLTATEAAAKLGVDPATVRALISEGTIKAEQVVKFAPWEIRAETLELPAVHERVARIKARETTRRRRRAVVDDRTPILDGLLDSTLADDQL